MCGESFGSSFAFAEDKGSPPHVWGKLRKHKRGKSCRRITPTCVGKALPVPDYKFQLWDHPHMCGESLSYWHSSQGSRGSPPHVWGKQSCIALTPASSRITPTCVGKARIRATIPRLLRDHPHMCGESLPKEIRDEINKGSPPHVWGKRKTAPKISNEERITPTCVGKALLPLCD